MIAAVSSSWALLLGMAFLMIGNGLQGSLLGVRASIEAFPTTVTGLLMSAFYFGFLAGSILTPRLVIRVGHVRVFGALASLASTAILFHALFVNPATWGVMRLISGLCYAGLYVVAESWLNEKATNETRGQLLSIYMVITFSGMAFGQVLLNVGDPGRAGLFMLVSVLVSLAVIPILLSTTRGPAMEAPAPMGIREVYQASPTGVVSALMNGILQGGVFSMGRRLWRARRAHHPADFAVHDHAIHRRRLLPMADRPPFRPLRSPSRARGCDLFGGDRRNLREHGGRLVHGISRHELPVRRHDDSDVFTGAGLCQRSSADRADGRRQRHAGDGWRYRRVSGADPVGGVDGIFSAPTGFSGRRPRCTPCSASSSSIA